MMLLSKVDKQIGERMQHIKYIYGVEELRERCRAALNLAGVCHRNRHHIHHRKNHRYRNRHPRRSIS